MKKIAVLVICMIVSGISFAQESPLEKLNFIIGDWAGPVEGFDKSPSKLKSNFQWVKDGKEIQVSNRSRFENTGFHIAYDSVRQVIFCNRIVICDQYFSKKYVEFTLIDSLSTNTSFVFVSEKLKNMPESDESPAVEKACWIIKKVSENEFEDRMEFTYPGKDLKGVWTSRLIIKQ